MHKERTFWLCKPCVVGCILCYQFRTQAIFLEPFVVYGHGVLFSNTLKAFRLSSLKCRNNLLLIGTHFSILPNYWNFFVARFYMSPIVLRPLQFNCFALRMDTPNSSLWKYVDHQIFTLFIPFVKVRGFGQMV